MSGTDVRNVTYLALAQGRREPQEGEFDVLDLLGTVDEVREKIFNALMLHAEDGGSYWALADELLRAIGIEA